LDRDDAIAVLDTMSHPSRGILERKGHAKPATYYLAKTVANDLIGKVAYSSSKGIDAARYAELVRGFVQDHGSITNKECRLLFGLGETASEKVEVSRYLKKWSEDDGFLIAEGNHSQRKYRFKNL
jgi:ATP-dependent DNA helicase RecG